MVPYEQKVASNEPKMMPDIVSAVFLLRY